jgi:translation initiation factor 6
MKIQKFDLQGNPNIGLFAFSTDKFCVANIYLPEESTDVLEKTLHVPVIQSNVLGTPLTGVFVAGNSKGIIVSEHIFDYELKALKKELDVLVLKTKHTAMGNLIIANDNGCYISRRLEKFSGEIEKFLGVNAVWGKIAGMSLVGSLAAGTNRGCVVHKAASKEEKEVICETLGVQISPGTVNFGNPWIRSGVVANSNGLLVGSLSTGPEMGNVAEGLGFV